MQANCSRRWLTCAAAVIAATVCGPRLVVGQGTACLSADPTKTYFLENLRALYSRVGADSTTWKTNGFPFATDTAIALVTTDSTCTAAKNAYITQTGVTVTQVYTARIGNMGYVVTTTQDVTGEKMTYLWFTNSWVIKQTMGG